MHSQAASAQQEVVCTPVSMTVPFGGPALELGVKTTYLHMLDLRDPELLGDDGGVW